MTCFYHACEEHNSMTFPLILLNFNISIRVITAPCPVPAVVHTENVSLCSAVFVTRVYHAGFTEG